MPKYLRFTTLTPTTYLRGGKSLLHLQNLDAGRGIISRFLLEIETDLCYTI